MIWGTCYNNWFRRKFKQLHGEQTSTWKPISYLLWESTFFGIIKQTKLQTRWIRLQKLCYWKVHITFRQGWNFFANLNPEFTTSLFPLLDTLLLCFSSVFHISVRKTQRQVQCVLGSSASFVWLSGGKKENNDTIFCHLTLAGIILTLNQFLLRLICRDLFSNCSASFKDPSSPPA